MNYLLHRQRSPGAVIPIPEELEQLMGEMSREVLRAQPPNVISFLADYLEDKLARRENQRIAEKIVDNVLDFSMDIVAMLESVGIDSPRAEAAVKRIREEFHRHFETKPDDERLRETFREREVLERLVKECHFSEQEARKASRIIEQAYRTYYFRNAYKEPHAVAKDKDWRQAAKHTLGLYAQTGPTKEEMEIAARRIQAAYRAYYTRKRRELDQNATLIQRAVRSHQSRRLQEAAVVGVPSEILTREIIDHDLYTPSEDIRNLINAALEVGDDSTRTQEMTTDDAATLIQSVFRGHQTRKQTVPKSPTPDVDVEQAAILLQSTARGHLARKRVRDEKHQHEMATLLQSHARGFLARKQLPRNDPSDA
ncbi:abnormal spindle-like microcephaly-associated protein homolog [Anopheles marshallii]|uniref:abnormal spindle-like microcephaly-associated protein homolog n=1 Tax=Anopheles marshallii TaxID=1521116 RepID=UPI00237C192D|nr:abnormal spindle-like microcephaly-associated protein homolog [Anopheles marshallii]